MKQSIGYTQTINIMMVFITIIFFFIVSIINYYKAYKVNNILINSIEKYEGYNNLADMDIISRLGTLGYNMSKINCSATRGDTCTLVVDPGLNGSGENGYCIYECYEDNNYYHYKIATNMFMDIPVVRNVISIHVFGNTKSIYNFEEN